MTTMLSITSKYIHLILYLPVKPTALLLLGFWSQIADLYN